MATGLDELIDFLLSEIAICGTQGAGSTDFCRFIHNYFQTKTTSNADAGSYAGVSQETLGRTFYDKTWRWIVTHPDTRILHNNKIQHYSLEEFEIAEQRLANASGEVPTSNNDQHSSSHPPERLPPADSLLALRGALRKRLSAKDSGLKSANVSFQLPAPPSILCLENGVQSTAHRHQYRPAEQGPVEEAVFDDPSTTTAAPRLYASQGRIWQALTGHSMDLKKVPTMEFALLSLIAANGSSGITQPELTQYSGQDKRSVPHRTDELARKGYIVKKPVQAGKARTSICVHSKFVSHDHFTASGAVEDVFQEGQFVASGFTILLYNAFKDAGIVLTRDIRKRLGVPMRTWNKRAVQGALIRLDQTGMIKRFRIRKKKTEDSWAICIQVLREPRPEDIDNLGFKRQAHISDTTDELFHDDVNGDPPTKDFGVDMLDDEENETNHNLDEDVRIPPQWIPERLLANVIFEFVTMGGVAGWDAIVLRNRVVGPFWRRATESYLHRLTDDWERTQPPYLRHLAIIRDSRNTDEKKFIHYVYRTYEYFRQAVIAREALWDGVKKPPFKSKKPTDTNLAIDGWGFKGLNQKDFVRFNGTSSLTDVRSEIVSRKYGPRWDVALAEQIGYQKLDTPIPKIPKRKKLGRPKKLSIDGNMSKETNEEIEECEPNTQALSDEDVDKHVEMAPTSSRTKVRRAEKTSSGLPLTPEERIGLGLKPTGRLSKEAVNQILAHRQQTGDPTSLPDKITEKPVIRNGHVPLLTKEERLAQGLSLKGRLGIRKENEIREQRGLPKLVKKPKKQTARSVGIVLSRQQRIALGFNGDGRLHQHFIDALRKEQENDVPLDESPAVEAYREFLRAEQAKETARAAKKSFCGKHTSPLEDVSPSVTDTEQDAVPDTPYTDGSNQPTYSKQTSRKRKASDLTASLLISKKQHALSGPPHQDTPSVPLQPTELTVDITTPADQVDGSPNIETIKCVAATVHEPQFSPRKTKKVRGAASTEQTLGEYTQSDQTVGVRNDNEVTARLSPGVYVYASAKRKAARGRPHNAYIVVFKSSRLGGLLGFKPEADSGYESSKIVSFGALKTPFESTENLGEEGVNATCSADTYGERHSPAADLLKTASESHMRAHLDLLASPVSEAYASQVDDPNLDVHDREDQQHAAADLMTTAIETPDVASNSHSKQLTTETDSMIVDTDPPANIRFSPTSADPSLHLISSWSTANASAKVTEPSYESPYAPTVCSKAVTPAPQLDEPTMATALTATRHDTSEPETNESRALPQGVLSPIAEEVDVATPKKTRGKGTGPGIAGSQRSFRRAIILDILERCGYVFPLHGEIWRPFSALWDQRHGHSNLTKPGNTSVFDALDEMIREPAYGLTKMRFRVNARNATGSKERIIVVKKGMTPYDPAVKRLAYGMANHSLQRSHQYYPEEIRDLFEYQSSYVPLPVAPKNESVTLEQLYPRFAASRAERMKERRERIKREKAAAKQRNKQVEQAVPKRLKQAESTPREKRTRLASLNDKKTHWRWVPVQIPVDFVEAPREASICEPSPAGADSADNLPLLSLRPLISDIANCGADDGEPLPAKIETEEVSVKDPFLAFNIVAFTHPTVRFHDITGTFSTYFGVTMLPDELPPPSSAKTGSRLVKASKTKKRVRIDSSVTARPQKKVRTNQPRQDETLDEEFVYSSAEDSDVTSSEDEEEMARPKQKSKRRGKTPSTRQLGKKNLPTPTLLQRLTGLTGDPNDPIYKDPKQRQKPGHGQPWAVKKKKQNQVNKLKREREYAEALDHADEFKKLCLTLVLASSMSGEDGVVNWGIVEKVYVRDKFFDLLKVKKIWIWMQTHMAMQLVELVDLLQSNILEAYEAKKLPTINDPETYDWAGLVRWTMRTCAYPELPLPLYREALAQFSVDESRYATVDRTSWYGKKIADSTRTHLQLQLSFVAPLHGKQSQSRSINDMVIRARSWTRANIATPQSAYNANQAHEKLKVLGEDVLIKVVGDYVQEEHLKMRKLKRQLPGRNYTFTKKFAKAYKRPFELEDFMVAVMIKKELDTAFADEDPEKRFYSISRCEEDGSIMAIMSMVAGGKAKLVPQLPPVNDEFGAPLPRLSKWGFCEGDYIHRAIDRNRLFWDTHVVPTATYKFGNPLYPLPSPTADWPPLAEPPLPGKHDPDALLPIWSSIDGQSVTWPWWYRILNVVLQPLFLQPGATANDVFSHCAEHTTELFEVQLVLGWLESVGVVSKIIGGGYQATANFWAAFGDRLLDTADDWFGEFVKRKQKMTVKQQWRDKYNLRYSAIQKSSLQAIGTEREQAGRKTHNTGNAMSQRIAGNAKAQYRIMQQTLLQPILEEVVAQRSNGVQTQAAAPEQTEQDPVAITMVQEEHPGELQSPENTNMAVQQKASSALPLSEGANTADKEIVCDALPLSEIVNTPVQDQDQDVEMIDADADAEGEDEDAEGEYDDMMY